MIQFKRHDDEPKYASLDFRLKHFVELWRLWCADHNVPSVLITDVDTPGIHLEGGPHYRRQAVDLSIRSVGLQRAEEFAEWIDAVYDYGRGYRVVVVGRHDPHGRHDDHVHLQVPPPYRGTGRIVL